MSESVPNDQQLLLICKIHVCSKENFKKKAESNYFPGSRFPSSNLSCKKQKNDWLNFKNSVSLIKYRDAHDNLNCTDKTVHLT